MSMTDIFRCGGARSARFLLGASLAAALVLAPAAAQAEASADAEKKAALKMTLDGRVEAANAPFFVALDRGLFLAAGLDVTIAPSAGGTEPIARVASGQFDVGVADINALIRYRDQNPDAPVKAVFMLANRPGYAVIGRRSRGVSAPADLNGKRLGIPASENAAAAWPAFARLNGIDLGKLQALNVGSAVREPMLAAGEVDAVTGTSFGSPIVLREKGVPAEDITTFLMGRFGIELYGTAVIANSAVIAERPEALRAFLRAVVEGVQATVEDPGAAVSSVLQRNNGNPALELERLRIVIRDSIATGEAHANGLGDIDPQRFAAGLSQLAMAVRLKNTPDLPAVFDPSFLPPPEERRVE